jgi:hypothetical protein
MTIVFCIRTPRMSPTPLSLDSLLASTLLGFVLALGLVNLARGPRPGGAPASGWRAWPR